MKILILIPARGGSKGIPQKNSSLLNGHPLIYYAIQNARAVKGSDIYVSTDDAKIKDIAKVYGVKVLDRSSETANDCSTIDDVVFEELQKAESGTLKYDIIITLQPTSPTLKKESLLEALQQFINSDFDTLISAKEIRHLFWERNCIGFNPMYKARVNRQMLESIFEETGAFVICLASNVRENKSRIGKKINLFLLLEEESIDIDSKNDWILAENILRRKNIAFVTRGDYQIGMGHIYRSITLGSRFSNHNVYYFSNKDSELGIDKLKSLNHKVNIYENEDELIIQLKEKDIHIVINDILDTDFSYIEKLKSAGFFVVNFEDTGDGAVYADLLFNALYEWTGQNKNARFGYNYECLRDDIYLFPIKNCIHKEIKNILIGFGGTDVNNATQLVLEALDEIVKDDKTINLVLGIGYKYEEELLKSIAGMRIRKNVMIYKDIPFISKLLYEADLIISGNGRMVYEAVSIGTPLIVCSQNERESSHTFAKICPGIKYLGNIKDLDKQKLVKELTMVNNSYDYRCRMNQHLYAFATEIRNGINRISDTLWETYNRRIQI